MTTLYDSTRRVNPTRPFGPELNTERRKPYGDEDLAWAAYHLNANCTDYEVVLPALKPIRGGAPVEPDYDRLADESAFLDRYERGDCGQF